MGAEDGGDVGEIFFHIVCFELVDLIGDDDDVFLLLHQVLEHVFVISGRANFGIDDEDDFVLFYRFVTEVPEDAVAEQVLVSVGTLGIAVAGEVDEIELVVDDEEIELLGMSWCTTRTRQILFASKGIDDA